MSKPTQTIREEPSISEFEDLFVNNGAIAKIEAHINEFNPIKVMNMEHMEIRHSAILAWLFDPRESHGLEDNFLKAFLAEALRGRLIDGGVSALDVMRSDLRDAIVRKEWHNIDLFISCNFETSDQSHTWAFVIENKFHSKQYEGQLSKYREKIETVFKTEIENKAIKINGVFLTLYEEPPEDTTFSTVYYSDIVTLLSLTIEQNSHTLTPEVLTFLTHYINILKEATGMSKIQTDMEKLARDLYLEHKKVIDFVVEHGASTDFVIAARNLFGDEPDEDEVVKISKVGFYYSYLNNTVLSFMPEGWVDGFEGETDDIYDWPGCEDWWAEYPLISWLKISQDSGKNADGKKGKITLYGEVGRLSDHRTRKDLIEKIKNIASKKKLKNIKFQNGAENEGRKYSKFFKQNSIKVDDVHDSEEIEQVMRALLKKFRPEFEAISEALVGFHEYGMVVET